MKKAEDPTIISLDPADLTKQAANFGVVTPKGAATINSLRDRGAIAPRPSSMSLASLRAVSGELLRTTSVYFVILVLDDSGSIRNAGAEQAVIDAANAFVADLRENKGPSDILIAITTINGHGRNTWERIEDARPLGPSEYSADYGTPLYQGVVQAHEAVMAACTEATGMGHQARSITLTITDGRNESGYVTVGECHSVIQGLQESRQHIIGGMYRGDALESTFRDMGMLPNWIIPAGSTGTELMQAIRRFSQASSSASKSAKAFDAQLDAGVQTQTIG